MKYKIFSFFWILFLLVTPTLFVRGQDSSGDTGAGSLKSAGTAQEINTMKKLNVFVREGNVYLNFKMSQVPEYEIVENLRRKVLTIKFRNLKTNRNQTNVRFYNDILNRGQMLQVSPTESWFLVYTKLQKVDYRVLPNPENKPEMTLEFSFASAPKAIIAEAKKNLIEKITRAKNNRGEEILFETKEKTELTYQVVELPSFRIDFVLKNAYIGDETKMPVFFSELVQNFDYIQSQDSISFSLTPIEGTLWFNVSRRGNPERIIIQYRKANIGEIDTNLAEAQKYIQESENPNDQKLKSIYVKAEYLYREGQWKSAEKMFKAVNIASPRSDLGIRALFRAGDSAHQENLENPVTEGFSYVAREYTTAIAAAEEANKVFPEMERAYFNIGLNYLNGKFYDYAENYFRETIRRYPDGFYADNAKFYLGVLFQQNGEIEKSSRNFERVIETKNQSRKVNQSYYYLGKNYYTLKDFEQAKYYFDRARNRDIRLFEKDPEMLFYQAETYFEVGENEKARSIYEQIVSGFPDFPKRNYIIIRLGDYHRDRGQENSALRMYEKAINSPDSEFAVISRIRIANMISHYDSPKIYNRAIELYKMVINEFPDRLEAEEAMLRLASTYSIHGRYKEALRTMDSFKKLYPESEFISPNGLSQLYLINIVRLLEQRFREESYSEVVANYKEYEDILKLTPESIPYILVFKAMKRVGSFEESNTILYNAISHFPKYKVPLARYYLGKNFYDRKQYKNAIEALKINEEDVDPRNYYQARSELLIAKSYAGQNLAPEATKIYTKFLKDYENTTDPIIFDFITEAWFDLGEIYRGLGKYFEALNSYQKSIDSYKHSLGDKDTFDIIYKAFYYLGDMNFELKEYNAAKRDYQKALSIFPDYEKAPWANYQIGYIYQLQENYDPALSIYKKLIEQAGPNSQALWARLATEGKREIELKLKFKNYLEDPNTSLNSGS